MGTSKQSNALSNVWQYRTQKYFYFFFFTSKG
jgi:hypothetical protein